MPVDRGSTWQRWIARAHKLRTHPTPIRFLASRALWHTGISDRLTVALPDGLRVRFYPSSMSAALWMSPNARNDDAEFLRLVLSAGDTYVDCGANIGHLAAVARAAVGTTGTTIAIEPNPRIFQYCVGNLKLNGFTDVATHNVALGFERGSVRISDRRDDDQNHVGGDGVEVEMLPLDDLLKDRQVTLLKLDVEGYELNVLRGASRTLTRTSMIYCELSPSNLSRFGSEPHAVEDLLLTAGFAFARRHGTQWQITRDRVFDTTSELPTTGFNLVGVKTEAVELFAARLEHHGHRVR